MSNTIYTFYQNIYSPEDEYQKNIIDLWKKSWEKKGFTACVLHEKDAYKHPFYNDFVKEIKEIHLSMSGRDISQYGLSCFERWIAYAALEKEDSFYVSDYDIINNNFKPQNLQISKDKISFIDTLCPSFAIGNSNLFESFCNDIVSSSKTKLFINEYKSRSLQNYHDQEFLLLKFVTKQLDYNYGNYDIYEPRRIVSLYNPYDSKEVSDYEIIHVSHSCCGQQKEKFPDMTEKELRVFFINRILEN